LRITKLQRQPGAPAVRGDGGVGALDAGGARRPAGLVLRLRLWPRAPPRGRLARVRPSGARCRPAAPTG